MLWFQALCLCLCLCRCLCHCLCLCLCICVLLWSDRMGRVKTNNHSHFCLDQLPLALKGLSEWETRQMMVGPMSDKKCTCWAHVDCPTRLICNWIFICFLWQSYKKRAGKSKSARWALAARDSPPFPKVEFLLLEKKSIMLSNAVSRKDEKNYWFWFNIVHTLHSTRWLFVLAKDNRANLYDRDTLNL